jgi:hypothetical protein
MGDAKTKRLSVVGGIETEAPKFEASFAETLTIKRFLEFAQDDVKFQFSAMNRDRRNSRDTLREAQSTAIILASYLAGLREGVEAMALAQPTNQV